MNKDIPSSPYIIYHEKNKRFKCAKVYKEYMLYTLPFHISNADFYK